MRARYALIFGHGAARHQLRQAASRSGLIVAADADALLVTEPGASTLIGRHCAVVGRLWTSDFRAIDGLEGKVEDSARSNDWSALPAACWGNYVLFTTDEDGHPRVYRDPSGSVGAFHLRLVDQDLFFSDAEFVRALGFLDGARPDLRFAVHWMQFPFLKTARSGLQDVSEVLAGTWRHRNRTGWTSALGWNPWAYAAGTTALRKSSAVAVAVRDAALATIPAQLRGDTPALQLSGGLDSSIIALCAKRGGIDCPGVHFVTSSADGDEQRYAQEVADICGIMLTIVSESDLRHGLERTIPLAIVPGANPVLAPIERAILQAVGASGAESLVDGGGGDNLFCYLTTAAPVVDALRRGPPGAARRAVTAVAEITHSSWWDVVKAAVRVGLRPLGVRRWHEDLTFLNRELRLAGPDPHPWLGAPTGALEGRREHIETIAQIQHFFDRRTDWSMPVLHPLLAQPMLELCLGIPSWLWIEGGRDRAIARTAFEGLVPQSVLARRMKGSLQGFIQRSFEAQRSDLCALLLDGELRRNGIVEPSAIEAAFRQAAVPDAVQLRLTELASLEQWMRSWRA